MFDGSARYLNLGKMDNNLLQSCSSCPFLQFHEPSQTLPLSMHTPSPQPNSPTWQFCSLAAKKEREKTSVTASVDIQSLFKCRNIFDLLLRFEEACYPIWYEIFKNIMKSLVSALESGWLDMQELPFFGV